MGGIRLSVHPLFFILGIYYAAVGRFLELMTYTAVAVVHELGHSFAAAKRGYRLNKIVLMPFGAVVKGNIDGLKPKDEVLIAFAGPLTNLVIGLSFVALWWLFPLAYPFTELAAAASISTAVLNLFPAYPLDGGRILTALLAERIGSAKAHSISKWVGVAFSVALFIGFLFTLREKANPSLLFFALFVFFGAVSRVKDNVYIKVYSGVTKERLMRGMNFKRQAIEKHATVKKVISLLDENAVNEIVVFDGERKIALLSQEQLTKIIEKGDIYSPIERYL